MHTVEEQLEAVGFAAVVHYADANECAVLAEAADVQTVTEGFVLDVLAALTDMALRSKRRQADLDAALRHARIEAGYAWRMAALERLRIEGCVDNVVELSDGGVLLSVTAAGLDRLGGVRLR